MAPNKDRMFLTTPEEPRQLAGSEYGGVQPTVAGGIQPVPEEALTAGDQLRLSYLTGASETRSGLAESLDDRRQMMGLRPADGRRPTWLENVNPDGDPRLESEASREGFSNS